jgi:hypothetical protein
LVDDVEIHPARDGDTPVHHQDLAVVAEFGRQPPRASNGLAGLKDRRLAPSARSASKAALGVSAEPSTTWALLSWP